MPGPATLLPNHLVKGLAQNGRGCVKTQIPKLVCAQEYFKMSWELAYGFLWTL